MLCVDEVVVMPLVSMTSGMTFRRYEGRAGEGGKWVANSLVEISIKIYLVTYWLNYYTFYF
jgi:hypothetical protein